MASAVILGNVALLLDGSSYKNAMAAERTAAAGRAAKRDSPAAKRDSPAAKRDSPAAIQIPLISVAIDGRRRKASGPNPSKIGASSSSSSSANGGGGGGEGGGGGGDWEEDLKRRLKELEEMRELEKKAAEIQSKVAEEVAAEEGEETEETKRERVKRELEKVAKEQAERRETAKLMFELGQKAYGKGMYARAIEFLEAALTIIPRPTFFGGEIQIWLAMAYEANNRHKDCITLYLQLEKKHPNVSIRRQAAELRYILQAPKIKITKDEMVTIPLIGSPYDSYAGTWSDKYKDQDQRGKTVTTTNRLPSSRDFLGDFMVWRPPSEWEKNGNFWLFLTLWLGLIGTALLVQR